MEIIELIYFAKAYPIFVFFYFGIGMIAGQIFDLLYRLGMRIQLSQKNITPDEPTPPSMV
ncbi:MAG: hypothetical protein JKY50_01085 [Oleispira sp.]|nr:hypothetical protein [Oleispira sp.]